MDFEGDVLGFAGFVSIGFVFGIDLDAVDDGTEFLGFVFAEGDFGFVLFIKFIGEGTGLNGVLVEVELGFGEGVGGIIGIDEDFLSVDQLILLV